MDKNFNYEDGMAQIQAIVDKIENGQVSVTEMLDLVKQAAEILKKCRAKLTQVGDDINKILDEAKQS
ncbi:MAG: exodeoxyribonuclease VII small subunit [Salinivirgaceae bacterium]|nr:exodeoxyribonuclease VII small subunit [Salinivirgaceae bacterium]